MILIYNKAFAYKQLNDYNNSLRWYNEGLTIESTNLKCLLGRANLQLTQQKYDESYADFVAAYKLDPSNLDIVYNIGVVLIEQKKLEAAVAIFT